VTIVAALGGVSLRQWQRASELLFREQARDVASMAAEKIELTLGMAEDAFLDRLQATLAAGRWRPADVDALVAGVPLVSRLYLLDTRGATLYPDAPAAAAPPALRAEVARGGRERTRHVVADGEAYRTATLEGAAGTPLLAAFTRGAAALRREVLERALGGLESPTILAVLDDGEHAVYSRAPLDDTERLLSVALRDGLPNWQVVVYQPRGASPRQTMRRQVMLFMGAFTVLMLVIVAGVVATARLVRRETEMAALKSDFVANVSHDLKTPLSVIRMFGETLEMGRVTDEARRQEYYRVITRESERLSRLIDNVLDFSRIEGGRRRYDLAPTAVEPLVRETLEAFAYPLEQQGFKVQVDIAPDLPEVDLDAEAVGQALANLIDNAIKYSPNERRLGIEARVADGRLLVTVADRGLGIPRHEQARIFEKFYRIGRSDTQGARGSGVGLALARHVAEAHRGGITVDSAPGEGSRFTLWMPVHG
jgi:signal transduction histidine kinase